MVPELNLELTWNKTWIFTVSDDSYGEKLRLLKQGNSIASQMNTNEEPNLISQISLLNPNLIQPRKTQAKKMIQNQPESMILQNWTQSWTDLK